MFPLQPPILSAANKLQVDMNTLFDKNKASLQMYNELIDLFNGYIDSPKFSRMVPLFPHKQFMIDTERMFCIESMQPIWKCLMEDNNCYDIVMRQNGEVWHQSPLDALEQPNQEWESRKMQWLCHALHSNWLLLRKLGLHSLWNHCWCGSIENNFDQMPLHQNISFHHRHLKQT